MPKIKGFPHFLENHILDFPSFFAWMLVLGSVKKWRFCFFRKTRKLDILGRVCPKFEPKCSKIPKIEGFPHLFWKPHIGFAWFFCMNASLRECKNVTFLFFQKNSKIGHFGPRLSKIWAKMVKNAQNQRFSAFFRKPHIGFAYFFHEC